MMSADPPLADDDPYGNVAPPGPPSEPGPGTADTRLRRGPGSDPTRLVTPPDVNDRGAPARFQLLNLPPALAVDYRIVRQMPSGGEANLVLVIPHGLDEHEHSSELRMAKLYNRSLGLANELLVSLSEADPAHVVHLYRWGEEQEFGWELLEYCPLGSLRAPMREAKSESARQTLADSTFHEVAPAIAHFHDQVGTHRDIKPENILVRSLSDPFDLVLADFGLIQRLGMTVVFAESAVAVGSVAYMAPEVLAGRLSHKVDWWSLGMIVAEIAIGHHPLSAPGGGALTEIQLRSELVSRDADLDDIEDARLRLACAGLLTRNPEHRWGETEVAEFLGGGSPQVVEGPVVQPPIAPPRRHVTPFAFVDPETDSERQYNDPRALARAMALRWNQAAAVLRSGNTRTSDALLDFLSSAGIEGGQAVLESDRDPEANLVRLLLLMNPEIPPTFRGRGLTREGLIGIARESSTNQSCAEDLAAIQEFRVLRQYATPEGDRADYAELESAWDALCEELERGLRDHGSRLSESSRRGMVEASRGLILLGLLDDSTRQGIRDLAEEALRNPDARMQPWFSAHTPGADRSVAGDLLVTALVDEAIGASREEMRLSRIAQEQRHQDLAWARAGLAREKVMCGAVFAAAFLTAWLPWVIIGGIFGLGYLGWAFVASLIGAAVVLRTDRWSRLNQLRQGIRDLESGQAFDRDRFEVDRTFPVARLRQVVKISSALLLLALLVKGCSSFGDSLDSNGSGRKQTQSKSFPSRIESPPRPDNGPSNGSTKFRV